MKVRRSDFCDMFEWFVIIVMMSFGDFYVYEGRLTYPRWGPYETTNKDTLALLLECQLTKYKNLVVLASGELFDW